MLQHSLIFKQTYQYIFDSLKSLFEQLNCFAIYHLISLSLSFLDLSFRWLLLPNSSSWSMITGTVDMHLKSPGLFLQYRSNILLPLVCSCFIGGKRWSLNILLDSNLMVSHCIAIFSYNILVQLYVFYTWNHYQVKYSRVRL